MSLVLNVPHNPQDTITSLQRELHDRILRIRELEDELDKEKLRNRGVEVSAASLRNILTPLYNAIGGILGHIDAMDITATDGRSSEDDKVWESWKQKLGGKTAAAIDALRMHGPMTQAQLRIQLGCATRTVTNVVGALNKAALINKANGKIALKELYK